MLQIVKQLTLVGGLQHHLRDFSHHFSLCGLMCSIFTQFSSKVIGTDTNGKLLIVDLDDKNLIGKNFAEKVFVRNCTLVFHMVSDMAGSKSTQEKVLVFQDRFYH